MSDFKKAQQEIRATLSSIDQILNVKTATISNNLPSLFQNNKNISSIYNQQNTREVKSQKFFTDEESCD